jgi:TIR domain
MPEKKLRIFLSYASEQRNIAEEIEGALVKAGHVVFFDKKSLPVGEEYNRKIIDAIKTSDLMIFLISPDSVQNGSYTIAELEIAKDHWKDSNQRFFPIEVIKTNPAEIPNYLRSVTILYPKGNIAAETFYEIDKLAKNNKEKSITEQLNEMRDIQIKKSQADLEKHREELQTRYEKAVDGVASEDAPSPYLVGILPAICGLSFSVAQYWDFINVGLEGFVALIPALIGLAISVYMCLRIKAFSE